MNNTFAGTHHGLQINTNQDKGLGCITSMLDKYQALLTYMVNVHSKVMQVRFDLHYPDDRSITPAKQHIYDFNYNLKRKLQRDKNTGGHLVDPQILWTEEGCGIQNPHYHFVILLNGNAKNNYWGLLDRTLWSLWEKTINASDNKGLVDYCDKNGPNGLMVVRSSPDVMEQLNKLSYQASYLTKIKTKDNRGKGNWLMGGSRVDPSRLPLLVSGLDLFG